MNKILITGPEASGKSALCSALSRRFNVPWVPEAARAYLGELKRPYKQQDLSDILENQLKAEKEAYDPSGRLLLCDTGPEVLYVWSEEKYRSVSADIKDALYAMDYKAILLLKPDLPWEPDPLRESPDLAVRMRLFNRYVELLNLNGFSFEVIEGSGERRTELASQFVLTFLNK